MMLSVRLHLIKRVIGSPILVWEELRLRSTERFRYWGWQTCPGPTSGVHGEHAIGALTGRRGGAHAEMGLAEVFT
jgi:hypothetical protein